MICFAERSACFAERSAHFKDPRIFGMLGLRCITAFAQVSFFHSPGEAWDTWLTPENELRDLAWLAEQPAGRRGLHLGGHFAHDDYPEKHGHDAAKFMAAEIRRRFPGERQPIDLLYIDHEGRKSSTLLTEALAPLLPLCRKAANFNFFDGPGYWGETGKTAINAEHIAKGPLGGEAGVGGLEVYGAGIRVGRFKRAIRMNPGCVPIFPVCSRDTDWSRLATWGEITAATAELVRFWVDEDPLNTVCMVAPYMLDELTDSPDGNYWHGRIRIGFGRSLEYLGFLDRELWKAGGEGIAQRRKDAEEPA